MFREQWSDYNRTLQREEGFSEKNNVIFAAGGQRNCEGFMLVSGRL